MEVDSEGVARVAAKVFIRCIGSGFIVELECSMRIQIPISGPDEYSMVYWSRVTIP